MVSLHPGRPAFFSIHSLAAIATMRSCYINNDIIEIYLVLNGRITITGKGYRTLLDNNTLYCTRRDQHSAIMIEDHAEGYMIRFEKSLLYSGDHAFSCPHFPDFQALVLRGEVLPVNASFLDSGVKLCEMMCQEFKNENDANRQMLVGFLSIFLLHITRKLPASAAGISHDARHTLIHKFNVLLEQKFKTSKKVADYAALLFVTPNYLNEIIKQATGNSVGFHIRQRVMLEAVRQARLTGASMKEVAWQLGFHDNAHFSKFFKKVAGRNFSELRKAATV